MTDIDWTQFSDEELAQIPAEVWGEQTRRTTLAQAPAAINKINTEHLAALGIEPGDSWVKPVGGHHAPQAVVLEASQEVPLAYPKDWVVSYAGTSWKSLIHANVWEPGVANWQDVNADPDEWPAWVQPLGAHDAYLMGDKVSHRKKKWTSDLNGNTWEPGVHGWTKAS